MIITKDKKSGILPLAFLSLGLVILIIVRGVSPWKSVASPYLNEPIPEFNLETAIEKLRQESVPFQLPLYEKLREELILWGGNFIEVNLSDMRTRTYSNGEILKEYSILARGDSKDWGGSPAGLYIAESKYTAAFSVSANAYMPFAIGYYGKYYFHGIPYYPNGARIYSKYSRGCLRYDDVDAKAIFNFTTEGMPILVIDSERDPYTYPEKEITPFPELSAESYIIADIDSGFVFEERGSLKKYPIASITKLMTTVIVIENVGIEETIRVTEEMLDVYGSNPGFQIDKRYSISQLLPPLLTRSTNQAAEILAHFLGREKTIELMNEKTKSIMMRDTYFEDPSGLSENNISTSRDLFYLLRYIFNNRYPIWKITKGEYINPKKDKLFSDDELGNRNIFIYDPTFIGGKIGFTDVAKHTGAFLFNLDIDGEKRNIAIILLKSQNVKYDTQKAYIWLLNNYFEESKDH